MQRLEPMDRTPLPFMTLFTFMAVPFGS
jgi:hypothetical protein